MGTCRAVPPGVTFIAISRHHKSAHLYTRLDSNSCRDLTDGTLEDIDDLFLVDEKESVATEIREAAERAANPDRTLRELQTTLPWTVHYHRDFRSSPMAHKDFGHALTHVFKAAGKLAALVNEAEHKGCEFKAEETDRYVADLVVCALRLANTCPGRTIDLQRAVQERIETKNGVKL